MPIAAGQTLGRYRLESTLGRGGMAEVFKATDTKLGRAVAVKVIQSAYAEQPQFAERFLREARLVAGLEHPNILPVYDFGEHEGVPYLVMPYLDGGTLAQRMDGTPIALQQVVPWIRQLAGALDFAHQAGVLHRDVKPANVLVGKGDRPMLADFGIAKAAESATRLTATGVVVGTPVYMAPELALGKSASAQSDLYALAVVAYELLTGQPPFAGESALSLMHQHVQTPAPPPSSRVATLPGHLDEAFRQALAKEPGSRQRSCLAFADALASALSTSERAEIAAGVPGPWSSLAAQPTLNLAGSDPRATAVRTTAPRRPARSVERTMYAPPRRPWPWVLAGLVLAGGLGFGGYFVARRPAAEVPGAASAPAPAGAGAVVPALPPSPAASAPAASAEAGRAASEPRAAITPPLPPAREAQPVASSPAPAFVVGEGERADERMQRPRFNELRTGLRRLTRADFEAMASGAHDAEIRHPGALQARLAADYAAGGLAYLAGDVATARQRAVAVMRSSSGAALFEGSGLRFVRKASKDGAELLDWHLAVGYCDARREAAGLLDAELKTHPHDDNALLARAFVHHLDGEHEAALAGAAAVYATAPSPRVAQLAGEENQHLERYDEALRWYRVAIATAPGDPGPAALLAAQVAGRELGRQDDALAILKDACDRGNQVACREHDRFAEGGQLGSGQSAGRLPLGQRPRGGFLNRRKPPRATASPPGG